MMGNGKIVTLMSAQSGATNRVDRVDLPIPSILHPWLSYASSSLSEDFIYNEYPFLVDLEEDNVVLTFLHLTLRGAPSFFRSQSRCTALQSRRCQ